MDLLGGAYGSDSDGEGDRQEEQGGGGEAVMIESAAKRAKLVGLEGGDAADADFCAYYNYPEKDGDGNYTVSLPLERQNIGRVIGNKGVRIRKITGDTGAKCTIQQPPYGSNWASATLTGTPDAIKAAHALVFQYQQLPAVVPVDGTLKDDPNYKLEVCKDWLNNPKTGCMHAEAPEECFFAHGLKDQRKKKEPKKKKKNAPPPEDNSRPKDILFDWKGFAKRGEGDGWDNGGLIGTQGQVGR
mmetsp:Transcript_837/g.3008  ORF Transcript_837/g.3008 Transcript_837/m.3008 type:complete len:243 (+) Transcript_837:417-1145(+)